MDNPSSGNWVSTAETPVTVNGTTSVAQGKIGIYYNYCAASAGSYCYGDGTNYTGAPDSDPVIGSLQDVTEDICPYGWRLPTDSNSGEYHDLYVAYGNDDTNFQIALSVPLSGIYGSSSAESQGERGFFWSSTWNSTYGMYFLGIESSDAKFEVHGFRHYGASIRCLLDE